LAIGDWRLAIWRLAIAIDAIDAIAQVTRRSRMSEWLDLLFRAVCSDPDWPPHARFILDWMPEGAYEFNPSEEEPDRRLRLVPSPNSGEADGAVPFWIKYLDTHHRADTTARGGIVVNTVDGDALVLALLHFGQRAAADAKQEPPKEEGAPERKVEGAPEEEGAPERKQAEGPPIRVVWRRTHRGTETFVAVDRLVQEIGKRTGLAHDPATAIQAAVCGLILTGCDFWLKPWLFSRVGDVKVRVAPMRLAEHVSLTHAAVSFAGLGLLHQPARARPVLPGRPARPGHARRAGGGRRRGADDLDPVRDPRRAVPPGAPTPPRATGPPPQVRHVLRGGQGRRPVGPRAAAADAVPHLPLLAVPARRVRAVPERVPHAQERIVVEPVVERK
jgi:hypothetical protein